MLDANVTSIDAIGLKYTYKTNCIKIVMRSFDVTLMQLVMI